MCIRDSPNPVVKNQRNGTPYVRYRGRELLVGFLRRQTEIEDLQRFVDRCGQQAVDSVKEDVDGKMVFTIPGAEKAGKIEDWTDGALLNEPICLRTYVRLKTV